MLGKLVFVLGMLLFLAAAAVVVMQAMMGGGTLPKEVEEILRQFLDMGKQFWLPETFALAFSLLGLGIHLISSDGNGKPAGVTYKNAGTFPFQASDVDGAIPVERFDSKEASGNDHDEFFAALDKERKKYKAC